MNDSDSLGPQAPTNPEPPSSPASVPARGQSIWNRIKAILAMRTVSLRDDLQVALEDQGSAEADFSESERTILANVLKLSNVSVADVMVSVFDQKDLGSAIALAGRLRADGLRVLVYPDADKIGKQIKYADSRGIAFVALLGSNEVEAGTVTVKNLTTQTQNTYDQSAAGAALREALKDRG